MDGSGTRAEVGTGGVRAAPSPGIVLDDWLQEPAAPPPHRGGEFAGRSPLARRIISFNVLALGALVIGILYLTQFEDGLIAERERGVLAEARVLAQAIARGAGERFGDPDPDLAGANETEARSLLQMIGISGLNRVQLFDRRGRLLADTAAIPVRGVLQLSPPDRPEERGVLGELRAAVSALFSDATPLYAERLVPGITTDPRVFRALEGRLASERTTDADGRLAVGLALPVARNRAVLAAVLVTTWPGEIDVLISNQRAQIMQVFGIAVIVSVALSLVLANTIARPLRRLAEAAEQGEGRTSRLMNPERIRIPDMTGRLDEIGYLSGAMRKMTRALYDRIEHSEVFAAEVAHEIKNPLTSLRSAVETLRYAKTDQARERLLAVIEKDVVRLDRLVTDISNASRLDSEMVREEMETFSMTELLGNLVEFNQPKAATAGGGLLADLPEDPLYTSGLENRLAQVFVNLVANAISFMGEGGAVRVAARRLPQGGVRVEVCDTGPGIPDENLKDIFGRFYSERPQGDFGNHSGLGLSISRQIVDAHGGRIWAENIRDPQDEPDGPRKGARFIVELPA